MNVIKAGRRKIEISNTKKMFFPAIKYTKEDVIKYYHQVSEYILPHIKNRPISVQRAPDGMKGDIFVQQNAEDFYPEWIDKVTVKKQDGKITHPLCNNTESLIYLVDKACITFHIWLSITKNLNYPDKLIFDLDPPEGSSFDKVISGALDFKQFFDDNSVSSFVMTTGSMGLHIVIPLKPEQKYQEVREDSKKIAEHLLGKKNDEFTLEHNKSKRKGRLFLDYLRNSYGATSVCPYSIRLLDNAPVAAPLEWDELDDKKINSQTWHVKNILSRLSQKNDPWKDIYKSRASLEKIIERV